MCWQTGNGIIYAYSWINIAKTRKWMLTYQNNNSISCLNLRILFEIFFSQSGIWNQTPLKHFRDFHPVFGIYTPFLGFSPRFRDFHPIFWIFTLFSEFSLSFLGFLLLTSRVVLLTSEMCFGVQSCALEFRVVFLKIFMHKFVKHKEPHISVWMTRKVKNIIANKNIFVKICNSIKQKLHYYKFSRCLWLNIEQDFTCILLLGFLLVEMRWLLIQP